MNTYDNIQLFELSVLSLVTILADNSARSELTTLKCKQTRKLTRNSAGEKPHSMVTTATEGRSNLSLSVTAVLKVIDGLKVITQYMLLSSWNIIFCSSVSAVYNLNLKKQLIAYLTRLT